MYGPWTVKETLYKSTDAKIALTTDDWILKIGKFVDSESEILTQLKKAGVRRSVEVPDDYKGTGWFAMHRYDDYLACNVYCRMHWRTFAVNILEFLEDLHHIGLVHMDIKKANILIDKRTDTCVVADYEHAVLPNHKLTREYPADASWYYIALGAEPDKPLFSWRMDLVAVAYALSDLSAPKCRTYALSYRQFEHECYMRRTSTPAMTMEEILVLRGTDIAAAHPDLQEYWRRVGELSWYATTPPPRSFYLEMRALLTGFLTK